MGKDKHKRFEDIETFSNVSELTDFEDSDKPKGKWNAELFGIPNPITLELACGKGEYTIGLARRFPDRNFIGVDLKGNRIWKGAKTALDEGLGNVRFLRIYIDHLAEYFGENEVEEIWITFPDPYLRGKYRSKRLTSSKFLGIYKKLLTPDGIVNLKTDDDTLFQFTLDVIEEQGCEIVQCIHNVYTEKPDDPVLAGIQTFYEKQHIKAGKTIRYVSFRLPEEIKEMW